MNYYGAREARSPNGRSKGWHYTVMNDRKIHPIGYCAGYPDFEKWIKDGIMPEQVVKQEQAKAEPFRGKYHDHFHPTEEKAKACYQDYLIDHKFRISKVHIPKCKHCGCITDQQVFLDDYFIGNFCEDHQSVEFLRKHHPKVLTVMTSVGSY